MKYILPIFLLLILHSQVYSQEATKLITSTTVKIGTMKTKDLYFGLKKGDKLMISLNIVKGKNLKEFEIFEYPNEASIFMDYKVKKIEDESITIENTGIYKFSFKNTSIGAKVCKFKIERIPESPEDNFNATVYWKSINDTMFYSINEKHLLSIDTSVKVLIDKNIKVNSKLNQKGNVELYSFYLPQNTISWSYYIDVDQQGQKQFNEAVGNISKSFSPLVKMAPGFGPLISTALDNAPILLTQGSQGIYFTLHGNSKLIGNGNIITEISKVTSPLRGLCTFQFTNKSLIRPVKANLKAIAILAKENWTTRTKTQYKLKERKEPYLKNQPQINSQSLIARCSTIKTPRRAIVEQYTKEALNSSFRNK